jgi:hypothetical protein
MIDLEPILPTLSICRYPGFKGNNSNSLLLKRNCVLNKAMDESTCIKALHDNMFNIEDFIGKLDIGKTFLSNESFEVPLASFRPIIPENDLVGRYVV